MARFESGYPNLSALKVASYSKWGDSYASFNSKAVDVETLQLNLFKMAMYQNGNVYIVISDYNSLAICTLCLYI